MYGPGLDVFERSSSYQLSINFVKCRFYCDCLNAISSGTWRYNHNATASVRSRLDNCKQKHHKSLAAARAASNYVMEILENVLVWCKMLRLEFRKLNTFINIVRQINSLSNALVVSNPNVSCWQPSKVYTFQISIL